MAPPPASADPRVELAGRRTALAAYRTALALDRTTLAWVRTALTFETFGLGLIGFFRTINQAAHTERTERLHQFAIHVGVAMVVIGMVALLFSAASHARALRRLRSDDSPRLPWLPLSIVIGSLVAVLCLYVVWWVLVS